MVMPKQKSKVLGVAKGEIIALALRQDSSDKPARRLAVVIGGDDDNPPDILMFPERLTSIDVVPARGKLKADIVRALGKEPKNAPRRQQPTAKKGASGGQL